MTVNSRWAVRVIRDGAQTSEAAALTVGPALQPIGREVIPREDVEICAPGRLHAEIAVAALEAEEGL